MTEKLEYNNLNIFISDKRGTVGNGSVRSGLIKGADFSGSILIPKKINNDIFITEISKYAFRDCKYLKSVRIKARLTIIPQDCFYACYSLEYVNIPSSVSIIDVCAFSMYPDYSKVVMKIDFEPSNKLEKINYKAFEWNKNTVFYFRQKKIPFIHSDAFMKAIDCIVYTAVEGLNFGGIITKFSPYCLKPKTINYYISHQKMIFLQNILLFLICAS